MSAPRDRLMGRIRNREARCSVIGLGYVGLPLAVELADAGFPTVGIDLSQAKVEQVGQGHSYVADVPSERLARLVEAGMLSATTDFQALAESDCVSICVPTPLAKTRDPDVSYIQNATTQVADRMHESMLVALESTTYPGTTREILLPAFERSGLRAGEDFFLAFSPERVDPGNPRYGTKNTPKVVGGVDPVSGQVACEFYRQFIDTVVPVESAEAAEMVKILENTFRSVNIGLVNEMAIMCDKLGIDVWDVIRAASTKPFGFMPFFPGPGLGGHCIPVDPHYLSWKLRTVNYNARFIELAGDVNAHMPDFVVTKAVAALNSYCKAMNGSRILVLGVAYKPDIDDVRESPALDVIHHCREFGADVVYHDPYVPRLHHGDTDMTSVDLTADELTAADLVIVTTHHRSVDWPFVGSHARAVLDCRDVMRTVVPCEARVFRL
jgi:UDP-N-acetyl-D-glucosamine dehydrogenase